MFDAAVFFYQWLVRATDRHKFTVVSHRGQKQFNIVIMGFTNSLPYIQRIDVILHIHRNIFRVYVNDIIVFDHILEKIHFTFTCHFPII